MRKSRSYGTDAIGFRNLAEWVESAKTVEDPDRARNVLYYGFQPLYDSIIKGSLDGKRENAVAALEQITDLSVEYLTCYYSGNPNVSIVHSGAERLEPNLEKLKNVPFTLKSRNMDRNGITPSDVLTFLRSFIKYSLDGQLPQADYVIGAACGASEMAMPLAGITGAPLGFMRKSKRRDDGEVHIVNEHKEKLLASFEDKNVFCVEDYVCTGRSLRDLMSVVSQNSPKKVIGLSVNFVSEGSIPLQVKINQRKFRAYQND